MPAGSSRAATLLYYLNGEGETWFPLACDSLEAARDSMPQRQRVRRTSAPSPSIRRVTGCASLLSKAMPSYCTTLTRMRRLTCTRCTRGCPQRQLRSSAPSSSRRRPPHRRRRAGGGTKKPSKFRRPTSDGARGIEWRAQGSQVGEGYSSLLGSTGISCGIVQVRSR